MPAYGLGTVLAPPRAICISPVERTLQRARVRVG